MHLEQYLPTIIFFPRKLPLPYQLRCRPCLKVIHNLSTYFLSMLFITTTIDLGIGSVIFIFHNFSLLICYGLAAVDEPMCITWQGYETSICYCNQFNIVELRNSRQVVISHETLDAIKKPIAVGSMAGTCKQPMELLYCSLLYSLFILTNFSPFLPGQS